LLVDIIYIFSANNRVLERPIPLIESKHLKALSDGETERGSPVVSSTFRSFGLSRAAGLISTAERKRISRPSRRPP
jgi:hypothetical protein